MPLIEFDTPLSLSHERGRGSAPGQVPGSLAINELAELRRFDEIRLKCHCEET